MTQHQKAQWYAKNYCIVLICIGTPKAEAWNAAMALFKLEMQK